MSGAVTRGQVLRFLVVGGCGFAVDVLVFQWLIQLDGGLILSRLISASAAITVTWVMNRVFTFKTANTPSPGSEYLRYISVQGVGLVLNLGCYFLLVLRVEYFAVNPLLALCAGAGLAIVSHFLGSKFWVFRADEHSAR